MAGENHWEKYSPSVPLAIITATLFAGLTLWHLWLLIKARTWFCLPVFIGSIFEVVGFSCRAIGHYYPYSLIPYVIQALTILLAPIFFAATVYMILSRLIRATGGERLCIIRVSWVTKLFVGGDMLCFLLQMVGAAFLASAKSRSTRDTGEMIILIGLIVQIVVFAFFLIVSIIFHRRLSNASTSKSLTPLLQWKRFMFQLYTVSFLITLRNTFRVVEYAQGEDGYLLSTEWPIYAMDALPMVIVVAICLLWHVGKFEQPSGADVDLSESTNRGREP